VDPQARPRPSRIPLVAFSLVAALGLAAAGLGLWMRRAPPEEPAVLGSVPAFSLTERSGRTLRRADLDGRPWVADFIFTRCGGICPLMTSRMKALRADVPGVTLVSFSVDPEHDTPEVLRDYAARHGIDDRWLLITGDQASLYQLARDGFKLAAAAVPPEEQVQGGDGPFLHSSRFVLVDARSRIRGYYDSNEPEALARLRHDVAALGAAP
jgi:protein SCO1/2